jgi:four helix bundle protein
MERAAVSVPSNVAEGHDRDSPGDFVRFLRIAKGSNAELRTQLYLAARIGLLDVELVKLTVAEKREISAMLHGLIKSIQTPKPPPHGS